MCQRKVKVLEMTCYYSAMQAFTVCDSEFKNLLNHRSLPHLVLRPEQPSHCPGHPDLEATLWPSTGHASHRSMRSLWVPKFKFPLAPLLDHTLAHFQCLHSFSLGLSSYGLPGTNVCIPQIKDGQRE